MYNSPGWRRLELDLIASCPLAHDAHRCTGLVLLLLRSAILSRAHTAQAEALLEHPGCQGEVLHYQCGDHPGRGLAFGVSCAPYGVDRLDVLLEACPDRPSLSRATLVLSPWEAWRRGELLCVEIEGDGLERLIGAWSLYEAIGGLAQRQAA